MKRKFAFLFAMLMLVLAGCSGTGSSGASGHVVDYSLDIPSGFEETDMDDVDACWYRSDGSNINLLISESDSATGLGFQLITADLLRTTLTEQMSQAYGKEPTIEDRYFTENDVCGLPAYQYCYDLDLEGITMSQLIVSINADEVYTFTFTASDEETLAILEDSAASIDLTLE